MVSASDVSLRVFRELMARGARPGTGFLRARVTSEVAALLRERRRGEIEALAGL